MSIPSANTVYQLRMVRKQHPFLDWKMLTKELQALVTSRWDSCSVLHVKLPLCLIWNMQLLQKVEGMSPCQHITLLIKDLYSVICYFSMFSMLHLVYKALNGLSYLISAHSTCGTCTVAGATQYLASTCNVSAHTLWNSLSIDNS